MHVWASFFDRLASLNIELGVVVMLVHASRDRQDVQIEDNVLGSEVDGFEEVVCSDANINLILKQNRLTCLVESHDDDSSAVLLNKPCLLHEFFLTLLQGYTIDDALALALLQTRLNNAKLGGVYHNWH